ncbi:CPBP family intramembrane metalloprotease [Periweissella cryptocerci]|uniref:CPBP family intramembrane metalloprotease n=1 Tax=Periweissella cryptocerci TaxID=2506420 RepID=A0A4V1AIT1_9LACO|nr:type II CAAX endopeptidase family protein [Periweissella cryptocerci]QBO36585.1 CPBP family intramembrane metalloprotease [Periweissella cryptocerci]
MQQTTKVPSWTKRVLIFVGMVLLVVFVPVIIQLGGKSPVGWVKYGSLLAYVVVYIGIALLAWRLIKPYLTVPQFKKFTSSEINTIFKMYGLVILTTFVFNFLIVKVNHVSDTANQENIKSVLSMNHAVLVVFALAAVFIAPFVEEFIFRGLVVNYFFRKNNWWFNIVLSGVLFSLVHASNNILGYLLYATVGGILAYTYKKSGQIKMSIGVHMVNNAVAMAMTLYTVVSAK